MSDENAKRFKSKPFDRKLYIKYYIDSMGSVITKKDFYPPEDNRRFRSGVADIHGGDNFADYAKWFFNNYGEELFDE